MRKMLAVLLLTSGILLSACGDNAAVSENQPADQSVTYMESIPQETDTGETAAADETAPGTEKQAQEDPSAAAAELQENGQAQQEGKVPGEDENGVVDLTKLSSTMIFSEVYSMMTDPTPYIGKTIVMNGQFTVYQDQETGKMYFSCIVKDATACCAQGIEFSLAGEHQFPEDYPQEGEDITVQGTFEIYTEGKAKYMQLADAALLDV